MEKTDNEIIAEFMGMVRTLSGHGDRIFWKYGKMNYEVYDVRQLNKYQTSWDWLMPVCKKINELQPIKDKLRDSITPHINAMRMMKRGAIRFDIQETYNGVVNFIKWYNDQPKQNGN